MHAHPSADEAGRPGRGVGGAPMAPHAANLSRNVVIRSEAAEGVRGHTHPFPRCDLAAIANVSFRDLGRTTAAVLDGTERDANGRLVHIGTNQLARYPVHMHHLVDRACWRRRLRVFAARQRDSRAGAAGMSIHGSHYGLIEGNVVVDVDGAGSSPRTARNRGTASSGISWRPFAGRARLSMPGARETASVTRQPALLGSDNNIVVATTWWPACATAVSRCSGPRKRCRLRCFQGARP